MEWQAVLKVKSRVNRFVLLFEGRTGSSYCIKSLNAMGRAQVRSEGLVSLRSDGWPSQETWIKEALTPPTLSRLDVVGFKTKLRDIVDRDRFAELLDSYDLRVLYMKRRNTVKAVVSMMRSRILKERTGSYNAYAAENRLGPTELDPELFDDLLRKRERLDRELDDFVASLNCPRRAFYYEDLLADEEVFFREICDFLGTRYGANRSSAIKNTSDDLSRDITNFDELRGRYLGTPYADGFDG